MTETEFFLNIESIIETFRSVARHSLIRIARSFGVECSDGRYKSLLSASHIRKSRSGIINDEEGSMKYRFHGLGCEITINNNVYDFQLYPIIKEISPILLDVFLFKKHLNSIGIKLNEKIILQALKIAVENGIIYHSIESETYLL